MEFQTNCRQCGKEFTAKRTTARYCGSKCRTRYNRSHKHKVNIVHETHTARDALKMILNGDLKELFDKDPHTARELQEYMHKVQHAFDTYNPLAGVTITKQWKCADCGQRRINQPDKWDKCAFCHAQNWKMIVIQE